MPQSKWDQYATPDAPAATGASKWDQYAQPDASPQPITSGNRAALAPSPSVPGLNAPSTGDKLGAIAGNTSGQILHNLNPVTAISGLGQLAQHPIDTLTSGMAENRGRVSGDMKAAAESPGLIDKASHYGDAFVHGVGGTVPVLGPAVSKLYDNSHPDYSGNQPDPAEFGKSLGDVLSFKAVPAAYEGVAGGLAKAARATAGPIAETALGVRKLDRAYGKTPGQAILDETKGVRPSTIADSARNKLSDINSELDQKVNASTTPASLKPALDVIGGAKSKALTQNSKSALAQLDPMEEHLSKNVSNGLPLSQTQTPRGLLNLKRGFGNEFVHNWNPETMKGVKSTGAQAYHALDSELDRTVPEAQELNQRASSLIPVAKRAESTDLNQNAMQRVLGRFARPTGGLASAIAGSIEGGTHFGPLGALGGAVVGGGLPELIASPTAQMVAARGLDMASKGINSPIGSAATRGVGAGSLLRKRQQPKE